MPQNDTSISPLKSCLPGSVPSYMFKPDTVDDVKMVFRLAHEKGWDMPLVIKNTGHDWMGRSAGTGSLGLWTHHWKGPKKPIVMKKEFVPQGCDPSSTKNETVFHFGAGEQWGNAYQFAQDNDMAVLGGTCGTVGIAGWLSGGGHSPLTPWYGMGVDNVRQVEIVTPKGEVLVANKCLNPDLFFAVRGGGGGTFGLVTNITYKALEKFKVIEFSAEFDFAGFNDDTIRQYFDVLTANAQFWASKGWGGYIKSTTKGQIIEIVNANSTCEDAKSDLTNLTTFLTDNGKKTFTFEKHDSWYAFFVKKLKPAKFHPGGSSGAVASRLLPPSVFEDVAQRGRLTDRLADIWKLDVNMWLMLVTPTKFPHTNTSALHPSWKDAIWSLRINSKWDQYFSTGVEDIRGHFAKAHSTMNKIREIAPGMGVSINEADIWEVDQPESYWGKENFGWLARIKHDVDPENVLTNWGAVGWNERDNRFKCYPRRWR